MSRAYKIVTHDLRSPLRGGEPLWDGTLPRELPRVTLDRSDANCGSGWHYCESPADAAIIAGLWPDGRPARLFEVEPLGEHVTRGNKSRAEGLRILSELPISVAVEPLSEAFDDAHRDRMIREQLAWHAALARPRRSVAAVEAGLRGALDARSLNWQLRRFGDARDAWDARAAWAAWDARDAWDARAAWDAWAARDALTTVYASLMGWIDCRPDRHTVGIRTAYRNGLLLVLPTGPDELGWVMS